MLGIIGGMGPQAGISLYQQILNHTIAYKDQDHIPLVLWSTPDRIPDRTEFLLGKEIHNPAYAVADIARRMYRMGITIMGIPCNTFHATPIWEAFKYQLVIDRTEAEVLHLVDETVHAIQSKYNVHRIGLLSTLGTYKSRLYTDRLEMAGIEVVEPKRHDRERLHDAIYNPVFGIKSMNSIGPDAGAVIKEVSEKLEVDSLLLGCTELCVDWQDGDDFLTTHYNVVNPLTVLANAMVQTYMNRTAVPMYEPTN